MHNYKIVIEYDGTNFVGWQQQENGQSIQSTLQEALFKLTGENISIFVSTYYIPADKVAISPYKERF